MVMPEFELLGSKVDETTLGQPMAFPRLIDNDALRANLPGLPATRFSVIFCTDHAAATGRMYRGDFDDPEDAWVVSEVYSAANQREMYHPIYDPVGNRILIQCHDNNSNGSLYNDQHAVLLETTDLANFTLVDSDLFPYGNHTGYGKFIYDDDRGEWAAIHTLHGDEYYWSGISYAGADLNFTLDGLINISPTHLVGNNKSFYGGCQLTQFDDDEWYLFDWETARPRFTQSNKTHIVAAPMYWRWGEVPRPKSGYYRLYTKGTDLADYDYAPFESPAAYKIEGAWYLMGCARDNAGENRLLLWKETATPAEWVPTLLPVYSDGRLRKPGRETVYFDWDAANDPVPSTVTITAISGSNGSSQSVGNYYELATGSGSTQTLVMNINAPLVNPTSVEVLEFTIYDWKIKPTKANGELARLVFFDNWTTGIDGVMFSTTNTFKGMGVYLYKANSIVASQDSYVLAAFDPGTNVAAWVRTYGVDMTLRLSGFGTKLTILLDGQVMYYRDLTADALTWNANTFAGIGVSSTTTPWDQNYMRFSRMKLTGYAIAPLTRHVARPFVGSGIGF